MAQHTVELVKGISVGGRPNKTAVLRELTAGDLIDAMAESERLIMVPGPNGPEPQLVMSNALLGIHTLRRQILSLGEIQGPIELEQLKLLAHEDMQLLETAVSDLDKAAAAEIISRGRSEAAGAGDQSSD